MQPLQCTECAARVLVGKNSWEHTSVQWDDAARTACHYVRDAHAGRPEAPHPGCPALTATVEAAARDGSLTILDDTPVPTPIVAP
ncbi:hypothetical protein [Rhodococcus sp. HNM0569]|uniref:hypothetical protein n=1 Tax=Rhodococcus sp. HNM0569 TaxID=2716340 RepID=UPI00146C712E|nr:hypothetical protein [Rhodococcus sp. HNM0569]